MVKNLPAVWRIQVRETPWRRAWQPTPVFLPGESHGQRGPAGYSAGVHKESDITEQLTQHNARHSRKGKTRKGEEYQFPLKGHPRRKEKKMKHLEKP